MQVDPAEVGRLAADLVIRWLDKENDRRDIPKIYEIDVTLNLRDSTKRVK